MSSSQETRRRITVALVVIFGIALGFLIKRVTIGLLIGLALGLLLSSMVKKK